jgi:hypothetical protein
MFVKKKKKKKNGSSQVLRKVSPITKDPTEGKLGAQCHLKGAYHLIDTTGKELPRAWSAEHLKKYFM